MYCLKKIYTFSKGREFLPNRYIKFTGNQKRMNSHKKDDNQNSLQYKTTVWLIDCTFKKTCSV